MAMVKQIVLLLSLLAIVKVSHAEPKASDGGVAIKKAQGIIRQLSQEKAALEAEKSTWLNDKLRLETQLKNLQDQVNRLQSLQAEVERYKSGMASVKTNLELQLSQQQQREQALLQKHNEVVIKARAIRDDNALLVQAVGEREYWIAQCGNRNRELLTLNQQLVEKYRDKSVWQQLAELEPVTGIASVDSESAAENYRFQLHQLQVTPFEVAAAQAKPPAANASEAPQ
jgi:chromosome segregation ATPase